MSVEAAAPTTRRRGLPQIPPFSISSDPSTAAHRWRVWVSLLNNHILFDEIPVDKQKLTLLLVVGPELHLHASTLATSEATYDDVVKGLTDKLSDHRTKEEYRFLFAEAKQLDKETLKEYYDRLHLLAEQGQYERPLDVLRTQLENGCRSKIVQRTLMSASHLPLLDAIAIATREEATDRRTTELEKREQAKETTATPPPPSAVLWVGTDPQQPPRTAFQHRGRTPRSQNYRFRQRFPQQPSWRHPPRYTAWPPQRQNPPPPHPWNQQDTWLWPADQSTQRACYNCGLGHPPAYGPGPSLHCPARGHQCRVCSKWNHFETVCFTARRAPPPYQQVPPPALQANSLHASPHPPDPATAPDMDTATGLQHAPCDDLLDLTEAVQTIALTDLSSPWGEFDPGYDTQEPELLHPQPPGYDDSASDGDAFVWGIQAVNAASTKKRPHPTCNIRLNGHCLTAIIDTGAHINVMPVSIYRSLPCQPTLSPPKDNLFQFGASIPMHTHGTFSAVVATDRHSATTIFYVTEQGSDLLLGYDTLVALDIVRIISSIDSASPQPLHDLRALAASFDRLFQGMGLLKNYQVTLHIDTSIHPVALPHRRISIPLRPQVEHEINLLEKQDIIERVEEPTPWVSPIVIAPKPKRPGHIRICVDMRLPNKAIQRVRHISPTVDDILADLNGATVFSKLDLTSGYHQLELHPDCRHITTFSTHIGLRRYKRLSFGISSAAEIFQNAIQASLAGLQGQLNVSDDILVFAPTPSLHAVRLHDVFARLDAKGLRLNRSKCELGVREIEFFGYRFSKSGISPDPAKVADIKTAPPPSSATEVRSFMGMVTYCGRFIHDLATIAQPLRLLTKAGAPWHWGQKEQSAFDAIKGALTTHTTLAYFSMDLATEMIVDASPVGLGAILTQLTPTATVLTLAYGSRALTPTEQRYSQTEREALAILWACTHFRLYVTGRPLTIVTDHKPLTFMFNGPASKPPARIERWVLQLQHLHYTVIYRPGSTNAADYLSRHPRPATPPELEDEKLSSVYVNLVATNALPSAITMPMLTRAYADDPCLQAAIEAHRTNSWLLFADSIHLKTASSQTFMRALLHNRLDLTLTDTGLLLKNCRLVAPQALWPQMIMLAHEGHQGISKTKSRLRNILWFPTMDALVEQAIRSCHPCTATAPPSGPGPIITLPTPAFPWTELSIDFCDIPGGTHILIIMDDHSKYPVVHFLPSTRADCVIPALDRTFAALGTPALVKSDNGPPFQSADFRMFADRLGFTHRKIIPHWPQANGEVERFMKTIKKALQIAKATNQDLQAATTTFLRAYRTTPHCSTGTPPATLLLGRPMQASLPLPPATNPAQSLGSADLANRLAKNCAASQGRPPLPHGLLPGDSVLLRHDRPPDKLSTTYHMEPMLVTNVKGSMVSASRGGRPVTRHASWFRRLPAHLGPIQPPGEEGDRSTPMKQQELPYRANIAAQAPPQVGLTSTTTPPQQPQAQQADGAAGTPRRQHPSAMAPPRASARLRQASSRLKDFYLGTP